MLPAAETYLYKHSRNAVIYYFKYSELSGIFVLAVKKDHGCPPVSLCRTEEGIG